MTPLERATQAVLAEQMAITEDVVTGRAPTRTEAAQRLARAVVAALAEAKGNVVRPKNVGWGGS